MHKISLTLMLNLLNMNVKFLTSMLNLLNIDVKSP